MVNKKVIRDFTQRYLNYEGVIDAVYDVLFELNDELDEMAQVVLDNYRVESEHVREQVLALADLYEDYKKVKNMLESLENKAQPYAHHLIYAILEEAEEE